MIFSVEYAIPSAMQVDDRGQTLGLATSVARPVRFHATVRKDARLLLRFALNALGQLVWSDDSWAEYNWRSFVMDPVITVHPDRVFFEAFSNDLSAYGVVIADRALFATDGAVQTGTTNVDFTASLAAALGEMRSSRETTLRIGPEGLAVSTRGSGGRFQEKVEIPAEWVRAFVQLQAAMTLPGTRFDVRPVDLLAAIRYLQRNKAKVSPRAMRYEFEPGKPVRVLLEPWEHAVVMKGSTHNYAELRTIRTWGRRRLSLLEPILPYATNVTVYLKGRALPSFYAVQLGEGLTFLLGLSGWTLNQFATSGGFDLIQQGERVTVEDLSRAREVLRERVVLKTPDLAEALKVSPAVALSMLATLSRRAQALYDVERREFRHRELFDTPIDEAVYFPPNERSERAARFARGGVVSIQSIVPQTREKSKTYRNPQTGMNDIVRKIYLRDWIYTGIVDDQLAVEAVTNDEGRLLFGKCGCAFFQDNYLNQGPCEHIAALRLVGEEQRRDLPTSELAAAPPPEAPPEDPTEEES